jgi:hypothetical protein
MNDKPVLKTLSDSLTAKQRRAIILLASGDSPAEVAEVLGVSKGTVYNWKSQNHVFRSELTLMQRDVINEGTNRLRSLISVSATTLRSILTSPTSTDRDKIAAVKTVLQYNCAPKSADVYEHKHHMGADGFLERMGLK